MLSPSQLQRNEVVLAKGHTLRQPPIQIQLHSHLQIRPIDSQANVLDGDQFLVIACKVQW
jgi:hypothetical protein